MATPETTPPNAAAPAGDVAVKKDWGAGAGPGCRMPSVTLKLAMDRNGAVDDLSEGPKRFTSHASLNAGEVVSGGGFYCC